MGQGASDILGTGKISEQAGEVVKKVIDGVTYTINKTISDTGERIVEIYKETSQGLQLMYKDTERNMLRTINNTQTLIANAYMDTEQNVIWGIRSPVEKALHIVDNHLDQIEQIVTNSIYQAFDMGSFIVYTILVAFMLFTLFFGKEIVIQIIDLIKSFKINFA